MKWFKIHYKIKKNVDSENFEWNNYDNVVYTDINECRNVCINAQVKFRDRVFEIYEVDEIHEPYITRDTNKKVIKL